MDNIQNPQPEVDPFASIKKLAREHAAKLTDEQVENLRLAFLYCRRNKPLRPVNTDPKKLTKKSDS